MNKDFYYLLGSVIFTLCLFINTQYISTRTDMFIASLFMVTIITIPLFGYILWRSYSEDITSHQSVSTQKAINSPQKKQPTAKKTTTAPIQIQEVN